MVNGKLGEAFSVTSVVKQGCPLAPTMFALTTEPFIRGIVNLWNKKKVEGMSIGKSEII